VTDRTSRPSVSRAQAPGLTALVGLILALTLVPLPIIVWALATILARAAW